MRVKGEIGEMGREREKKQVEYSIETYLFAAIIIVQKQEAQENRTTTDFMIRR